TKADNTCTVIGIFSTDCLIEYEYNNMHHLPDKNKMLVDLKDLHPIPLTEEWLLRLGFEKKRHKWKDGSVSPNDYWLDEFNVVVDKRTYKPEVHYILGRRDSSNGSEYIKGIEHVHQLQNLYFALTGEELKH